MHKKRFGFWLIFIGLVIVASFYFDSEISKFFQSIRFELLNEAFGGVTFASSIIIFIFLTSLFLWKEHKRKGIVPLWLTMFLSVAVSFLLKIAIQRQRPYVQGIITTFDFLIKQSHVVWDFSFPSSQAIVAFSAIPILNKEFPKFKYVWIIFASLVALSRVYFGVHFMSDVLVGGLVGYFLGIGILKLEEEKKFGERIVKKLMVRK